MKKLSDDIVQFFCNQGCVIVSTIDKNGFPHNACKGIVAIKHSGRVYLLDLYRAKTFENLNARPSISITAIDEHKFIGYSLKGKGRIITKEQINPELMKHWEDRIASRLTRRLLRNIHEERGHPRHPEVLLPKPEYMISMEVEEIVDLTPRHLK